jgi:2-phospho-L-lactate/phosphoenolpyruvate guanylyltransferase
MIAAVVPVKRLSEAKSRLASALTSSERQNLVLALLARTLDALGSSGAIDCIGLISPESDLGRRFGVEVIEDAGDLNASLVAGARWATGIGADAMLLLPADLPLIRHVDIDAIAVPAPVARSVSIAPTWDGGTGALLLSPPRVIPPSFGPGSFARHLRAAAQTGVPTREVAREAFERDLDTLADFHSLRSCLPDAFSRASL